ncbi:MAG TPA: YihY/virulence factor BrkB family protein [Candidatus Binataceae bacterium]|nr:YihY/virulence factor BrkB family protein [Candidatus Binataceae bacterium]
MAAKALSRSKGFVQQLFADFSADDCTSMAAALAYYTIFSLPSLLLIIIYIAGLVFGQDAASGEIQSKLGTQMGPQAAAEIQVMVSNAAHHHGAGLIATVLGLAGLIFSAIGVVMQLQMCINRAWKVSSAGMGIRSYIMKRINSGLLLVGVGILAIVSLAAGSVLSAFSRSVPWAPAATLAENLGSLLVFSLLFAVILKVLPDAEIRWRDVWLGAAVISILFILGKFFIGLYLAHGGTSGTYGAAGSLALILLWTYYSALVVLLGVEFTQVWVRQQGREIEPRAGAVRVGSRTEIAATSIR